MRNVKSFIKQFLSNIIDGVFLVSLFFVFVIVFLIGGIYVKGTTDGIPIAILDMDNTSGSRAIVEFLEEEPRLSVVNKSRSHAEFQNDIKNGYIEAGVIIPSGFYKNINTGNETDIMVMLNQRNYIVGNSASSKLFEILETANAGLSRKILLAKGINSESVLKIARPISSITEVRYNPSSHYGFYLDYGVLGIAIFSVLMLSTALMLKNRRIKGEKNTIFTFMACGFWAFFALLTAFPLMSNVFDLPFANNSYIPFILISIPYSILIVEFGLIFSYFPSRIHILQASGFFATPLFFITGFTWPEYCIPNSLKWIYFASPLSPYLNGVRAFLTMDTGWLRISHYLSWLIIQCLVYTSIAIFVMLLVKSKSKKRKLEKQTI